MATSTLARSLLIIPTRKTLSSIICRSYSVVSSATPPKSSFVFRLRPLFAAATSSHFRSLTPAFSTRGFASRQTSSSLNDPNPNWTNRPPKETILLDGCDFEHWLVVMEKPEGDPTRDEIINHYIKTLAFVVGSEEEARMKIYSVSTRHYYAFGALVSEELSYKLKEIPGVRWVLPDSYLDVKNKDYGGEPFINGQAVPYDPKYHEEWVRNNARANERNRRNDRPRNFDRSRNFDRRREMQNQNMGGGPPNMGGGPPNMGGGPPNMGAQPNNPGGMQQPNMGGGPGGPPNMGAQLNNPGGMQQPNMGGMQHRSNMGGQPVYGGGAPNNMGNYQPNMGGVPNNAPNYQYGNGPNSGGMPYQSGPGQNQNSYAPNAGPGLNQSGYGPNAGPSAGAGPGQNQNYPPNYSGGNSYQNPQNIPGRDMPPNPNH